VEGADLKKIMLLKSLSKITELDSIPLIDIDLSLFIEIVYVSHNLGTCDVFYGPSLLIQRL
jgi:hypothetical protein